MADPDLTRTARRRRIIGGALVAAFAVVLIAIVVVRSNGEKVLNENAETLVLVGEKTGGGMDALGRGTLADVGGCLGWAPSAGEERGTVVIWPHGTTIKTPDPLRVTVDGTTYELGDSVELGGGTVGPLAPSDHFYDKVPAGCRASDVFVASDG
ncbi:hypothetical protein IFT73_02685 [Aeromicrobium sp. CFBP 8757]|uniref:hypothetical protein n=1 Tax=Aeromicrobium sp. CFBP 8757 TaxID=2775288 RepID=UPI00177EC99A|nr:hypothetical protein [Aeromicrobium sp. CFBP 8757]MBD8605751.1 hypothetical protein [Aeromicrobium sp. CFBP 8757]